VPRGSGLQDPLPRSGRREKAVDVNDRLRLRSRDFPGPPANATDDRVSLPFRRRRNPPVRLGQASDDDGERDDEDQSADKPQETAQSVLRRRPRDSTRGPASPLFLSKPDRIPSVSEDFGSLPRHLRR
jgi:hypothetical protein